MNIIVVPAGARTLVIEQVHDNKDGKLIGNFDNREEADKFADIRRTAHADTDAKTALERRAHWIDSLAIPVEKQYGLSRHDFIVPDKADNRPQQVIQAIAEHGRLRFNLSDIARACGMPPRVVGGILTLLNMRGVVRLYHVANNEVYECRQVRTASTTQHAAVG